MNICTDLATTTFCKKLGRPWSKALLGTFFQMGFTPGKAEQALQDRHKRQRRKRGQS